MDDDSINEESRNEVEDERLLLENQLRSVYEEYERGELTLKGVNKRSLELKLKLLEVEYKSGELTDHGYEVKKKRLMEDLKESETDVQSSKASTSAHELKGAASTSRLSDSINKLFGKCSTPNTGKVRRIAKANLPSFSGSTPSTSNSTPSTSNSTPSTSNSTPSTSNSSVPDDPGITNRIPGKRRATCVPKEAAQSKSKKRAVEKPVVVETICLPNMTMTIPRGHYKSNLEDAGRVNYLKYMKSDTEAEIRAQIISLFPAIFKNGFKEFNFLDARSKYLEEIATPPPPQSEWNGAAIMTLTGQGRLFILPMTTKAKDSCSDLHQDSQKTQKGASIATYSIASSANCIVNHMSPVNSLGTNSVNCHGGHSTCTKSHSDDSLSQSPAALPTVVMDQLQDPYIGQAILEYTDKKESFRPDYPPKNLQPGETELYKIDWKIDVWKTWRSSVGKPPLRESFDKQFYIISEDEFKEFSMFCDSLTFLPLVCQKSYLIPQSQLLTYYMSAMNVEIPNIEVYNSMFYVVSENKLHAFADWIEAQLKK